MTTQSLLARTDAPDRTPADKRAGRGGRRLLRRGAGRQHHAGPLAYVLLAIMAILSIFRSTGRWWPPPPTTPG